METITREQEKQYCYEKLDKAKYDALRKEINELEVKVSALRHERNLLLQASYTEYEAELENGKKGVMRFGINHWDKPDVEFRSITKSGEMSKNPTILYGKKFKLGAKL
jgi:hypothetical protein